MIDKNYLEYLEGFLTDKRKELFKKVLNDRTRHFTVVLEDIFQSHNASAVVRSCDIFGIQDLHIIESKYEFINSRHVAKGAQKWLDFHNYRDPEINNTLKCIETLKSEGYQIIATTPHIESCYLQDFDISKKSAFFFGVEKAGLSNFVMDNADGFLKIPMVGFTESLNISVAAAIILQNLNERLKASTINWQLSKEEKELKYIDWMEKTIKSIKSVKAHYFNE
jgi:tRNA (guanosine-2'-O-)-methyltransferase